MLLSTYHHCSCLQWRPLEPTSHCDETWLQSKSEGTSDFLRSTIRSIRMGLTCWKARETVGHFGKETAIRKSMRMYWMYGSCLRNLCSGTSHQCSIRVSYRMAILKWNPSTQQVVKWWFLWPSIPIIPRKNPAMHLAADFASSCFSCFSSFVGWAVVFVACKATPWDLKQGHPTPGGKPHPLLVERSFQGKKQSEINLKPPAKPPVKPSKPLWNTVFLGSWKLLVAQGGTMLGPRQRIPLLAFALPHTSESRF